MANRYGDVDEPRRGEGGRRSDREPRQDRESGERRGGGYGIGGAERGYNMGGYGGIESYEQGYTPRSYDRLLDVTEHYYGYGDEEYGQAREEDEHYWYEQDQRQRSTRGSEEPAHGEQSRPRAVGFGGEPWSDEWMSFERSRGEDVRRQPLDMEWTARAQGPGKAPKGYTRSDERIREDVCERLMNSPYDASEVEITVNRGEVTLAGTVRNRADKWGIEDVAEAVLGVQDVHNLIRINREGVQGSGATLGGDTGHQHS